LKVDLPRELLYGHYDAAASNAHLKVTVMQTRCDTLSCLRNLVSLFCGGWRTRLK
jgi:hypothetical protein